jgi:CelD/BcsL family acetyltransferase involved in cellulose biosynthesis
VTEALRLETISSEAGLQRLSSEWDELVRAMSRPSPFLLHGWISELWRHYGDDATLTVHVARRNGRLVGALPLCRRRRLGLEVTEFVGTRAPLSDLLLAPGEDGGTAVALARRAGEAGADFADLFGLPASSRLAAALPSGSLSLIERLEAPVLELDAGWDAVYESRLSKKARSERRRHRRGLERQGTVEISVARTPEELAPALEDAFRLHDLRWAGRRDSSAFATPLGRRFHQAAVLRVAKQDVARLVTLRLNGRAISYALYLQFERTLYGVGMAFDPAFARFSPGIETLYCALERGAAEGVRRVEFLGAAGPHKQQLTDRFEPIYEGIGMASTLRGWAAVEALTGGIRLRRQVKRSETAKKLYYRLPRLSRT